MPNAYRALEGILRAWNYTVDIRAIAMIVSAFQLFGPELAF